MTRRRVVAATPPHFLCPMTDIMGRLYIRNECKRSNGNRDLLIPDSRSRIPSSGRTRSRSTRYPGQRSGRGGGALLLHKHRSAGRASPGLLHRARKGPAPCLFMHLPGTGRDHCRHHILMTKKISRMQPWVKTADDERVLVGPLVP